MQSRVSSRTASYMNSQLHELLVRLGGMGPNGSEAEGAALSHEITISITLGLFGA